MINKGNIIKISSGTLRESAAQDYTAYANNIHTNAAKKILENSKDGIVYGEPEKMATKEDVVNIVVGLFFDGTGNNRTNITRRESNSPIYTAHAKPSFWQDNTSYENDRTNVDHLEKMYKKETLYFSIYIEGIGTTNDDYDSLKDMGTGEGSTGIRGKVKKCCEELVKTIKANTRKDVGTLTVDVFGFSRGAAAARNFVHEITLPSEDDKPARGYFGEQADKSKLKIAFVRIRFAGLYDTVSAYGVKHSNDLVELDLNAINRASKIVHLTAADETREKFELTSVTTGTELSLPGVHSDIGGSYRDNVNEEVSLAEEMLSPINRDKLVAAERDRLIEQGWYRGSQMKTQNSYKLTGNRVLSNKYSLIPLHLMFEMGTDPCQFVEDLLSTVYKIPAAPLSNSKLLLTDVYTRIKNYAILKTAPPLVFNSRGQLQSLKNMVDVGAYAVDKYNAQVRDHNMLMELRNRYLHFSSSWDGVGKEPHINDKGERERVVFNPRST
jgi:hypothetical protein